MSNGHALKNPELSRFDAIVVSSEVGYEKPAPEIFKIALGIAEFNLFKLSFYIRIKCNDSRPDSQYTFVLKVTLWATPTNKKLQHTVCLLGLNYVTSSHIPVWQNKLTWKPEMQYM